MTQDYITECHKLGKWIPEKPYEWGRNKSHLVDKAAVCMLDAPRYWRHQVERTGRFAFEGWKVVVFADSSRGPVYER